jgi:stage II sporulation protein P
MRKKWRSRWTGRGVFRAAVVITFPLICVSLAAVTLRGAFLAELIGFRQEQAELFQVSPPAEEESSAVENWNFMEGQYDEPVDFLEEILPVTTPDPNRVSYEVQEINAWESPGESGVSVRDTSDSGLDLAEELKKDFALEVEEGQPLVLIYHTHTCESYLKSYTGFYYGDDSFRSTDSTENVCVVGEAMKESLEAAGIPTIHDTTIHDSPAFNGAYDRSLATAQSYLEKYPSIKITIDLHRDAMITEEGVSYKPTAEIEGKKAAQMMIIAGCDPTGELEYENWHENLIFALKLQQKGEEMYSGLMRPLMFCQRSYNMWLTDTSFLVEVGTQVNTFQEAEYSGRLMGNILAEVIADHQNG